MASSSLNEVTHLVVGGDSLIGAALTAAARAAGETTHASTRRPDRAGPERPLIDLSAPWRPPANGPTYEVAHLCAAVARLNDCFNDPEGSARVNVDNLMTLAEHLVERGTAVIFLSSNQVLDGRHPFPDEGTPIAPLNVYGHQKARAERGMMELAARFPAVPIAILRLSKVLAPGMSLFEDWAARLRAESPIAAAADMSLAPIPVSLVAEALRRLAAGRHRGLFQLSSATEINYVDAARHLCRRLGRDPSLVRPVSCVAAGYLKEPPPRHTIMNSGALTSATGIRPLDPYDALDSVFTDLIATNMGTRP